MPTTRPTIAIIGASSDRSKFGNKAVRAFLDAGWEVFPVHPTQSEIEGLAAFPDLAAVPRNELDRVSFYVPPTVGLTILDDLAGKKVAEVWFNPGSDSPELVQRAKALGLNVIRACGIVDIGKNPGDY